MSAGVRVLCYDVNGLRGDRGAMDAMVRELAPDVVIVQGAPRRVRWRVRWKGELWFERQAAKSQPAPVQSIRILQIDNES